jgi:hypothetical protein
MSEFRFIYGGVAFDVSWGMLFQRSFWVAVATNQGEFGGLELLVTAIYNGNKAYHLLNGGTPVFSSVTDVYKMLDSVSDEKTEVEIIDTFKETQTYKSMLPAEPEQENAEKKT